MFILSKILIYYIICLGSFRNMEKFLSDLENLKQTNLDQSYLFYILKKLDFC